MPLSVLEGAPAETYLRKLLTLPDDALRATAALAWLAGPARRVASPDAQVLVLLHDRAAGVRSATARGLGYLSDRKQARALAVQQRAQEQDAAVRATLDAAIRKLDEALQRQ